MTNSSESNPTSTIASRSGSTLITINAHQQIPSSLTSTNYPSWKNLVMSLFYGYDLVGYLTGETTPPALTNSDAYAHWFRQDKLILSALLGSLSAEIIPLVSAAQTSKDAWTILSHLFANRSRTRVMQLKENLSNDALGDRTVTAFLHSIKAKVDELAIIDKPLSDDDVTLYVLNGLGAAYREIAAPIRAREKSVTFEELHDLLVAQEAYLKRLETQTAGLVATANNATPSEQ